MHFVRKHDTLIFATPEAVFDYVCNPNSWPKWLAASHSIKSADHALEKGEIFHEKWQIKRGVIALDWTVVESERAKVWSCQAKTDFIGPIIIRYTFSAEEHGTRYTRELTNPDRPEPPTQAQLDRIDEEARIGLANIKDHVERAFLAFYAVTPAF